MINISIYLYIDIYIDMFIYNNSIKISKGCYLSFYFFIYIQSRSKIKNLIRIFIKEKRKELKLTQE